MADVLILVRGKKRVQPYDNGVQVFYNGEREVKITYNFEDVLIINVNFEAPMVAVNGLLEPLNIKFAD